MDSLVPFSAGGIVRCLTGSRGGRAPVRSSWAWACGRGEVGAGRFAGIGGGPSARGADGRRESLRVSASASAGAAELECTKGSRPSLARLLTESAEVRLTGVEAEGAARGGIAGFVLPGGAEPSFPPVASSIRPLATAASTSTARHGAAIARETDRADAPDPARDRVPLARGVSRPPSAAAGPGLTLRRAARDCMISVSPRSITTAGADAEGVRSGEGGWEERGVAMGVAIRPEVEVSVDDGLSPRGVAVDACPASNLARSAATPDNAGVGASASACVAQDPLAGPAEADNVLPAAEPASVPSDDRLRARSTGAGFFPVGRGGGGPFFAAAGSDAATASLEGVGAGGSVSSGRWSEAARDGTAGRGSLAALEMGGAAVGSRGGSTVCSIDMISFLRCLPTCSLDAQLPRLLCHLWIACPC